MKLVNDVPLVELLTVITEQDDFSKRSVGMYLQRTLQPSRSSHRHINQSGAMKKNVWQQHKIMVGHTRGPE